MHYGQLHFILFFIVALAIPSHAKTIFVDDNASAGGDGTSWASAHKYLQDALAGAKYGDEIWVAEGTYKPDQGTGKTAGDRASPFVLVNGVGMYGGFLGTESSRDPQGDNNQTILSGEIDQNSSLWSFGVITGSDLDANTTLDGFEITKGNANGAYGTTYDNGGGISLKNSKLNLSNLVFTNNSANDGGGGIYIFTTHESPSSLTLTNCDFTNNSTDVNGGGIYSLTSLSNSFNPLIRSSLTLTNCVFTNNSANKFGGGIHTWSYSGSYSSTSLTLTNCVFTNNSAKGIYKVDGRLYYSYGNLGGGISSYDDSFILSNSVFTKNVGGGINASSTSVSNCVFTNNVGGSISSTSLTLTNCVFWRNTYADIVGHGISSNSSPFKSFVLQEAVVAQYPGDPNAKDIVYKPNLNILQGWDGDARAFDADPLFVNIDDPIGPDGKWFTKDDGLRVLSGSPTIDKGYDEALPADSSDFDKDGNLTEPIPFDIMGYDRRQGSSVDIGAYESDPVFLSGQAAVISNPSAYNLVTKSSYDQALLDANATAEQAITDAKVSAKAEGVDLVKANPTTYGLYSSADLNASIANAKYEGETSVITDPASYGLVSGLEHIKSLAGESFFNEANGSLNLMKLEDFMRGTNYKFESNNSGIVSESNYSKEWNNHTLPGRYLGNGVNADTIYGSFDNLLSKDHPSFVKSENLIIENVEFECLKFTKPYSNTFQSLTPEWYYPPYVPDASGSGYYAANGGNPIQVYASVTIDKNYSVWVNRDLGIVKWEILTESKNTKSGLGGLGGSSSTDSSRLTHTIKEIAKSKTFNEGETSVTSDPSAYNLVTKTSYDQALLDANASAEKAIADAKVSAKEEGVDLVKTNPSAYNLVTQSAYDEMMNELMSASGADTTPYSEGWFYLPNQGWLWTNRNSYPYFYDGASKAWMYFQSGNDNPRFYHYGTKTWMTMD